MTACLLSKTLIADYIKHHVSHTTHGAHYATHSTCGMHSLMYKTVIQNIGPGRRGNYSTTTVQDSTDRGKPSKDALCACAHPSGDKWIIQYHCTILELHYAYRINTHAFCSMKRNSLVVKKQKNHAEEKVDSKNG